MKRNIKKREYYIQSIPVQMVKDFEFENTLRKFLTDNPSKQKNSNHGYHYNQNRLYKEKDHPRFYKDGLRGQIERTFAQMFS